jgi:signal transduction histidine kinase
MSPADPVRRGAAARRARNNDPHRTETVSDDKGKSPDDKTATTGASIRRTGPGAVVVPVRPQAGEDGPAQAASRPDWPALAPVPADAEAELAEAQLADAIAYADAQPSVSPTAAGRSAAGEPRVRPKASSEPPPMNEPPRPHLVSKPAEAGTGPEPQNLERPTGTAPKQPHNARDPIDPMLGEGDAPDRDAAHLAQSLRAAQKLYNESRRRFHDFVLAASDWVWETDEHGALTFISERITEVTGKPSRSMVGSYLVELGSDVVTGRTLRDALAARRPFRNIAIEIVDSDGKHRFCRVSGIPAFDQDTGRFIGFRGAGSDCTAQFEAEAMARRSQTKLERLVDEVRTNNDRLQEALSDANSAIRAKSEFLANVSHELRTPLNAIIGFTEIMDGQMYGPLGHERYNEYTESVLQSGRHLLSIINDLLDMAKVEAGRLQLKERSVDVAAVAEAAIAMMRDAIKKQSLDVSVRFAADAPPVWADERLVKQMLINLLGNAVKFTPEGGTLTVEGGLSADGGYTLSVSDTGIGIAPENLETVLEPFGQVESAMNRSHAGTGLGLPLVNAMIELHGGTLSISSAPGAGTTVTLRFPPDRVLEQPAHA